MSIINKLINNSIFKNFSILTISNVVVQGLAVLSSIKIAKYLKPELYGVYSLMLSISAISVILSSLGLRNIIVREVAVVRDSKQIFINGVISRTLMFIITCVGLAFYNEFLAETHLESLLILFLCIHIFMTLQWDSMEAVAFGFEKMKLSAYINVTLSCVWVLVITILPISLFTLKYIFFFTALIQIIKTSSYTYIFLKGGLLIGKFEYSVSSILQTVKEGFPFYILAVFTLFSSQLPVIYLEQLSTSEEIAFFNISFRIISPLQILMMTLLNSLFPNLAKYYETDYVKFLKLIKIAFVTIFLFGILGAFFISVFRSEVVELLYGSTYAKSSDVIAIQCWFTVLFGIFCLIGTILSAVRKQVLLSKLSFVYAAVSVPCLLVGAKYGAVGLSIGFVISGVINMTYHIYYLRRSIDGGIDRSFFIIGGVIYSVLFGLSLLSNMLMFSVKVFVLVLFLTLSSVLIMKFKDKLLKILR